MTAKVRSYLASFALGKQSSLKIGSLTHVPIQPLGSNVDMVVGFKPRAPTLALFCTAFRTPCATISRRTRSRVREENQFTEQYDNVATDTTKSTEYI